MSASPNRFDRKRHNRARVPLAIASAAGSTAWSLAGRGSAPHPALRVVRRADVILADRALPILNRN